MCGIVGIVNPNLAEASLRSILPAMAAAIVHRGPDDEGFSYDREAAIGMRRLSIIDLESGRQPITNESGDIRVVCNGEIYNYVELRRELEQRGHRFRTASDVEVIAHLYEEVGTDCFKRLRGMFAIAIWDQRARRMVVARDRLGKKPLYYAADHERFLFASEIKSLLVAEPSLAETNPDSIVSYFRFGFVSEPNTIYRQVLKLPPGEFAVFDARGLRIEPYWELSFAPNAAETGDPAQWSKRFDELLLEAVKLRLRSDVPLGVFLSGGLDSSAMVAYAKRAGLNPIKTFTIGFDRPEWDESPDAEIVARHFGTEHHVLRVTESQLKNNLEQSVINLAGYFDEPFGDSSALPTYIVSKLAREHVKVILSGDGGDELMAGYTIYKGIKFAEMYRRLPRSIAAQLLPQMADMVARLAPGSMKYKAIRAARVMRDSCLPPEEMYFAKTSMCRDTMLRRILSPALMADKHSSLRASLPDVIRTGMELDIPDLSKVGYVDTRMFLLEDMLVKVDRTSMANSLEVRSPLLDHKLVEFVAALPPEAKLRGWTSKAIFRDVLRPVLPRQILRKRKQGFMIPLRDWLIDDLGDMVGDYLVSSESRLPPEWFQRREISRLLDEHRRRVADHSHPIWLLLIFAAWHEKYIGQRVPVAVA